MKPNHNDSNVTVQGGHWELFTCETRSTFFRMLRGAVEAIAGLELTVFASKGLGSPVTIDRDVDMQNRSAHPQQVAVIPLRRMDDGAVQVCLIRKKNSAKWGIPKGYIERGDDWRQAALSEAHEEAGLDGRLIGEIVGTYEYEKDPLTLTVVVCVMEVLEAQTTWPEMRWRERRWCSIEEAGPLLKDHQVWALYNRIRPGLATMSPNLPLRPTSGFGEAR